MKPKFLLGMLLCIQILLAQQQNTTTGTISQPMIAGTTITGSALVIMDGQAHYQKHGPALLPDPAITTGAIVIRSKAAVCSTKWGTDARHVTQSMKNQVYALYGTAPGRGVCALKTHTGKSGKPVKEGCEIDHLISRELGGADKPENLWPQPYARPGGAHEKDWLENELHKEVCAGTISLEAAQAEIKADWYAAYLKRHGPRAAILPWRPMGDAGIGPDLRGPSPN